MEIHDINYIKLGRTFNKQSLTIFLENFIKFYTCDSFQCEFNFSNRFHSETNQHDKKLDPGAKYILGNQVGDR